MSDFLSSLDITKTNLKDIHKIEETARKLKQKINTKENSFQDQLKEKLVNSLDNSNDKSINSLKLSGQHKKLYDACVDMESFLWKEMLSSMRKTIDQYKLVEEGHGNSIFKDLLYDEYSKILAKNSGTGIAKEIYNQLSRNM